MDSVNKTLYIPLYGKAYVSKKGLILRDPKAEQIWAAEGFPLRGKSRSKWLAYYMGMRAAVFDWWLAGQMQQHPNGVILHLGCGMDSRADRVDHTGRLWFDVDFPDVIAERKRYYKENDNYRMVAGDLREAGWLAGIPGGTAIIVMEGVSMYLAPEELKAMLSRLTGHFDQVHILLDCYTELGAKASRVRNPINDVGVTQVYGLDDPRALEPGTGLRFLREHSMTPEELILELAGPERWLFRRLFAGKLARGMYRMYEYKHPAD